MTPLQKVFSIVGGKSALARHFGILPWAVSKWEKTKVPAERCPDIEALTNYKVTCEELRPDINWSVLRKKKK
ncbi:transcriptional regulator [Gallibacterium anatis]|uniref:transcriptional regulator n=1 Tax=Gallibacterium anatis TaxID=750 RepID=UPI002550147B|nr:helix-turn-helix domain-containing protein [Gallibacterium anatis]WIM82218.1 helix-turn-helix domain-containing protein [Gallibacterium anatis]WIM82291.1 helix-turn-helix domain-containing protein [Gallibacterium anatis]